jgi:hypothetical protein
MRPNWRRPRFGERVTLDGLEYCVIAFVVHPIPGLWLRPRDAADASADRLVPLTDWRRLLQWDGRAERWAA